MTRFVPLQGGCHCGDVRYEIRAEPDMAGYCHCGICRKLTGAPAMVWAHVPIGSFAYVAGEPSVYRSSEAGERRFCPRCGAQLEFRRQDNPQAVEVLVGTLDDPARVPPRVHIYVESRIPWFDPKDDLPRLPKGF